MTQFLGSKGGRIAYDVAGHGPLVVLRGRVTGPDAPRA